MPKESSGFIGPEKGLAIFSKIPGQLFVTFLPHVESCPDSYIRLFYINGC